MAKLVLLMMCRGLKMVKLRYLFYKMWLRLHRNHYVRVGDKLILANGVDPLSYIDLSTGKKHTYPGNNRYHFIYDVRVSNDYRPRT